MTEQEALIHFRELMRKRGIDALPCPACGTDAWGGFGDGAINLLEGRQPGGGFTGIRGSVHALLAICGRCGFLAAFDRDVIGD